MKVLLLVAAVCVSIHSVLGAGAGRAIPIDTENFVEELFQSINRNIQYDGTNFLVDLSGNYANCNFIGRRQMSVANRDTPEGSSIGIIQDFTDGAETHTKAVDKYLRPVFDKWVYGNDLTSSEFRAQIANADKFGCSVRPGCRGQVSVSCLFSPAYGYPKDDILGEQKAKAFTPQQYDMAEKVTGQSWDRAHYLENLSGYETRCGMVFNNRWDFITATDKAKERGMEVIGLYGYTKNEGSTPLALEKILSNMKRMSKSKEVGCSLIPDCLPPNDPNMYVVVSCVFEI